MANAYHPTLWRTCRVLASPQRLACLNEVLLNPDSTVEQIAAATGLSPDKTSQGLRALQSRGLLSVRRHSRWAHYLPKPDPLVPCAATLLGAMRCALVTFPAVEKDIIATLTAFTHSRRLSILFLLSVRQVPLTADVLSAATHISLPALWRHLNNLEERGLVQPTENGWRLHAKPSLLARTLTALTVSENQ